VEPEQADVELHLLVRKHVDSDNPGEYWFVSVDTLRQIARESYMLALQHLTEDLRGEVARKRRM
jgi:hypothetical protein